MAKIIKIRFGHRPATAGRVAAPPDPTACRRARSVKRLFDTIDACRYLGISRPTLLKYIAAGKIRARRIGRGWKIREAELARFLSGD
jgi:excisionase family DNA binding protein